MKKELPIEKDPKAEVQAAIDTLNEFNQQQKEIDEIQFSDVIRLVVNRFSESTQQNVQNIKGKLKAAVNSIKNHSTVLPNLEEGSSNDKNFARFAWEVILKFNSHLEKFQKQESRSVKDKIAAFFAGHHEDLKQVDAIELPLKNRKYLDVIEKVENSPEGSPSLSRYLLTSSKKVSNLKFFDPLAVSHIPYLSPQAVQLFYMKMISLIEKENFLTHQEARKWVHQASLKAELDPETGLCFVQGIIPYFPDHTIVISGYFEKDPKSEFFTTPSKKKPFSIALGV